jgi:hypothetical protein
MGDSCVKVRDPKAEVVERRDVHLRAGGLFNGHLALFLTSSSSLSLGIGVEITL